MGEGPDRYQVGARPRELGRDVDRDPARHLDEHPACRSSSADQGDAFGHLLRLHVVEHHDGRARVHRLCSPGRGSRTRPPPCAPATACARLATASDMAMPARWLSFTRTASDRLPR